MISITRDKRMLGYESLSSYSNISHFVTTGREDAAREIMRHSTVRLTVETRRKRSGGIRRF